MWESAVVQNLKFGRTVVVPLIVPDIFVTQDGGRNKVALSQGAYLIMFKDKQNKQQVEVVYKIADNKLNGKSFYGTVLVESWDGLILKGYRYIDGKEFAYV